MRTPPAQNRSAHEDGFILIEVLVSALVLAIVAAGVMAILSATTHSAASERVQSQAAGLAQEDQARLRAMRISKLNGLDETQPTPVELDGTQYTVRSQGTFVGSKTNEVVCNGESGATDYVRITSTVSSPNMRNPVVMQSMVAPSNGSLDQSHGTLSFNAKNAKGLPLSGVVISGTGPGTFSGRTDSNGCANFADLTAGNYKVTSTANGMINMKGETSTVKEYGAPSAGTQTVSLAFDNAGEIEPSFVYKNPLTGLTVAGKADSIEVYNGESGELARTFGTAGGDSTKRFGKLLAANVFPFKSKTTVYAGSCETSNPDPKGEGINQAALALVEVAPGGKATPVIQLPALNLTVQKEGTALNNASVTTTDTKCPSASSGVVRTYTTESLGHLRENEAGMPWGEYKVCAQAAFGSETRRLRGTVAVTNLTTGAPLTLNIKSSSPSEKGSCP